MLASIGPAADMELEQAVAGKHAISDGDLEQPGQARAGAIQDALLGSGTLDAARVFVMAPIRWPKPKTGKCGSSSV